MMLELPLLVRTSPANQTVLRHDRKSSIIDRAHPGEVRYTVRCILRVMIEVWDGPMIEVQTKAFERRR
jgi:hypothetical protein